VGVGCRVERAANRVVRERLGERKEEGSMRARVHARARTTASKKRNASERAR